ncbi:MAG: methionine gamma-lyase family protein, partial [Clostridia bacterium]|nr:methionine gamma-lyase family protein [Clostridia bacterium]
MNINEIIKSSEKKCATAFKRAEDIALYNQEKVLKAFWDNKIALRHFTGTSGYGYGDEGRDTLNRVYAQSFGAEKAVVSPNIVSGTHALTLGLFGILRPGDIMLSVTGEPYDTLREVISGDKIGSLKDFGVIYKSLPLKRGKIDVDKTIDFITKRKTAMLYLQRSRGYEWRDSFSVDQIGEFVAKVRAAGFDGCIFVDNCYGEFVEEKEPTEVGADIICGSLIKNPGG